MKPKYLIIDGGIARDGIVVDLQERCQESPPVFRQPMTGQRLEQPL